MAPGKEKNGSLTKWLEEVFALPGESPHMKNEKNIVQFYQTHHPM